MNPGAILEVLGDCPTFEREFVCGVRDWGNLPLHQGRGEWQKENSDSVLKVGGIFWVNR